jgi:hypothetical protein
MQNINSRPHTSTHSAFVRSSGTISSLWFCGIIYFFHSNLLSKGSTDSISTGSNGVGHTMTPCLAETMQMQHSSLDANYSTVSSAWSFHGEGKGRWDRCWYERAGCQMGSRDRLDRRTSTGLGTMASNVVMTILNGRWGGRNKYRGWLTCRLPWLVNILVCQSSSW